MFPSKKQKLVHLDKDASTPEFAAVISEVESEIDFEIALRLRLTETLASRIAWAESLQDAIRKGNGCTSSESFRTTALNTLSMLENPSRFITDSDPVPPPSTTSQNFIRPPPRKLTFTSSQVEFLYTRASSLLDDENNGNQLYILKCPMCGRTAFSKLQGILNHARLRHSLEWGTHDECIRACAVPDNSIDTNLGVEVGITLPGIRTIFRNAVVSKPTSQTRLGEYLVSTADDNNPDHQDTGTHLNQTLGLHADTSSLAPFLGKDVIRREIKIWDNEMSVEIEEETTPMRAKSQQRRWRMPFAQRNAGDSFLSRLDQLPGKQLDSRGDVLGDYMPDTMPTAGPQTVVSGQGRFHFIARIIITDRSMALPEGVTIDEHKGYTHKWMISVDSPSYAHPITSILHSIKVSPSNPTISIPLSSETTMPPFVVYGLADKPFLARVELSFAGTSSSSTEQSYQKMVFEHWVDLDPLKLNTIVAGQDQVLDVELDKNTVLRQPQCGFTPIESKLLWNRSLAFDHAVKQQSNGAKSNQSDPGPTLVPLSNGTANVNDHKFAALSEVVDRFPLVRTDIPDKKNQNFDLPYTLASSRAEFTSMLLGRRKAIEWRRVRAIRDAYNDQQQTPSTIISASEVHKWLSANSRMPRSELSCGAPIKEGGDDQAFSGDPSSRSMWCKSCGLHSSAHQNQSLAGNSLSTDNQDMKSMIPQTSLPSIYGEDATCGIVPKALQIAKLPRADVQLFVSGDKRHFSPRLKITPMDCRSLVSMTDPQLLLAILQTANQLDRSLTLRAPATPSEGITGTPSYPLQAIGEDRSEVEHHLAPYAILAVATRAFIRQLIIRGLDVANRDKVVSTGVAPKGNKSRSRQDHTIPERLLTPTHILSGILTRGRGRGKTQDAVDAVILLCLSKLGMVAEPRSVTPSCQGQQAFHVKIEE